MSTADIRPVPVEQVGDPARLGALAIEVFGRGQRRADWFSQKLRRECVLPSRSILLTRSRDATDAGAWVGYGLLGRPPSLGGWARTAGIGLIPTWRGRGLGAALVAGLRDAARDDGAQGMLVPASPDAVGFYTRCGLRQRNITHTLRAGGMGTDAAVQGPESWDSPCPGPVRSGWFAEAWERTASARRHTLRLRRGADRFDVSMEGSAQVAMRWTSVEGGTDGPSAWLRAMSPGTPALLHDIAATATELPALLQGDWSVAQTTITMQARWPEACG